MEYGFSFKDEPSEVSYKVFIYIYLQVTSSIKEQHMRLIRSSDFTITFSTSQTLYRDQVSWRSAAQYRPHWSSSEDWKGCGKLWRWCAQLSNATSSPWYPETSDTHHTCQVRSLSLMVLQRKLKRESGVLRTCSSPDSASRMYCFLIE